MKFDGEEAGTLTAMAFTVSSMGVLGSTRCW